MKRNNISGRIHKSHNLWYATITYIDEVTGKRITKTIFDENGNRYFADSDTASTVLDNWLKNN